MGKYLAAAGAALAVAALAACGSGTPAPAATVTVTATAAVQPAAAATPASPLPSLTETGASTSAVYGETDIEGDRYAVGQYPSGEQVTVYTFADKAAMDADRARNGGYAPTDTNVVVTGRLFSVDVLAVDGGSGVEFPVSPQKIAGMVGGTVVSG
jgi:hypothetical protein